MDLNQKIEKILSRVKTDPVYKYIQQEVIQHTYIIYDSKANRAVCTRCGCEWEIAPGEYSGCHNTKDLCLCCEQEAILKAAGKGRKNLEETFRVIYMFRYRKTAYAMVMYCRANFIEFGVPTIKASIEDLFSFNAKEQHRYHKEYNWYSGKWNWEERKKIRIPSPPSGSYTWLSPYYDTYFYTENIEDVFKKTDLKYLWIPELIEKLSEEELIIYIAQGMKYQSVELLYKAGFTNLVHDRLNEYNSGSVYWRGTNLQKILRLSMGDIRRIREHNPDCKELRTYQGLSAKEKRELPWDVISDIAHVYGNSYQKICKYTSIVKFANYIEGQLSGTKRVGTARGDWEDYIETAEKLGMDTRKNSVLFPENLKEAHDAVMDQWRLEEDRERDAKIQANARIVQFEMNGLLIVTALTQLSLNQESSGLGHCVKTYGDKLQNGRCRIYFIRREEDPDTPYYTLETTPEGNFVQCRGNKNCNMTEEIENFVNKFIPTLKRELKKKPKEDKKCQKKAAKLQLNARSFRTGHFRSLHRKS